MKTKDLIKLLQKYDPLGEKNITINDEIPFVVETNNNLDNKYYMYFTNDKLVFSDKEGRLNIKSLDLENWVSKYYNKLDSMIEFDFYDQNSEKINEIKNKLNKIVIEAKEYDKNSIQEFTEYILDKMDEGYKVIQEDTEIGKYNTMYFVKPNSKIRLRQGDCHAIIRGSFKPIIIKDHIEWEHLDA